jgi:deoxyribodipyrimidine photo-lyase
MPSAMQEHLGLTIGVGSEYDIPEPLVDLQIATREAKAKLHGLRAQPQVKAGKAAIVEKHGSRAKRPSSAAKRQKVTSITANPQIALDF